MVNDIINHDQLLGYPHDYGKPPMTQLSGGWVVVSTPPGKEAKSNTASCGFLQIYIYIVYGTPNKNDIYIYII